MSLQSLASTGTSRQANPRPGQGSTQAPTQVQAANVDAVARKLKFAQLRAYTKPLRGLGLLLRSRDYSMPLAKKLVKELEVADFGLFLHSDFDDECQRYHLAWMHALRESLGLPDEKGVLSEMSYLFFSNVGAHTDGTYKVDVPGSPYFGEELLFLNIQLAGSGRLLVGEPGHEVEHPIGVGQVYLFDPEVRHAWVSTSKGMNRAIAFGVPKRFAAHLLRHRSQPDWVQC